MSKTDNQRSRINEGFVPCAPLDGQRLKNLWKQA